MPKWCQTQQLVRQSIDNQCNLQNRLLFGRWLIGRYVPYDWRWCIHLVFLHTFSIWSMEIVHAEKKFKSMDCWCPYWSANAVPPTKRMLASSGIAANFFRSSRVLGVIVWNDSICNSLFSCLKWRKQTIVLWDRVCVIVCSIPPQSSIRKNLVSNANRPMYRTPKRAE